MDSNPYLGTEKTKLLTCWFWYNLNRCAHSDEVCAYAHYYTGRIAEKPVRIEPGMPAVAGRNARRSIPLYSNWGLGRRARQPIPANCAAQIHAIREKAAREASSNLISPADPSNSPTLTLPAPTGETSASQPSLTLPDPSPASQSPFPSGNEPSASSTNAEFDCKSIFQPCSQLTNLRFNR